MELKKELNIPEKENLKPIVVRNSKVYVPSLLEVEEEKAEVDANQK